MGYITFEAETFGTVYLPDEYDGEQVAAIELAWMSGALSRAGLQTISNGEVAKDDVANFLANDPGQRCRQFAAWSFAACDCFGDSAWCAEHCFYDAKYRVDDQQSAFVFQWQHNHSGNSKCVGDRCSTCAFDVGSIRGKASIAWDMLSMIEVCRS